MHVSSNRILRIHYHPNHSILRNCPLPLLGLLGASRAGRSDAELRISSDPGLTPEIFEHHAVPPGAAGADGIALVDEVLEVALQGA